MKVKNFFSILNKIIPKKRIILFSSYPPYSDNAMALYSYIIENRPDILAEYDLIWGQDQVQKGIPVNQSIKCVEKKSFRGYWTYLRAKYIITTHDYFSDVYPGKGQIQLNLWHGNGFKKIPQGDRVYRGDYTIATSDFYKVIQARELNIKDDNVYVTGLPRNDIFFKKIAALEKIGINKEDYKLIVLWMPTYRKANARHIGIDGNDQSFGAKAVLSNEFDNINAILRDNKILLLIKPHPMEDISDYICKKSDNIIFINNEELKEKNIELYSLLSESDVLLSDYSSVVIDYMLLNKPIAFVCSDMKDYEKNRGFVVNPIEEYLPGPIISNYKEFVHYFLYYDSINENWRSRREELMDRYHKYTDGNSSKRVCDVIFGRCLN